MNATDKRNPTISLGVTTAMAAVMLTGCAGHPGPRAEVSAAAAEQAMANGETTAAIRAAEAAVAAEPRNASYRMTLGNAYLEAGRFASAATTFDDAMTLGDQSPRAALSLALALTGQARFNEAASVLNEWESDIAAADLGLAYALSGQPERGIHILTNAIRGGDNTVKSRQNLAYAYAVAGRWREARMMVSQDVPAHEVGQRMEEWAQLAHAEAYQQRVAGLLGVPASVRDGGQPVHLALNAAAADTQYAAADTGAYAFADAAPLPPPPAPPAAIEAPRMAVPATAGELPPVGAPARVAASPFQQAFVAQRPAPAPLPSQSAPAPFTAPATAQSAPALPAVPTATGDRYAAAPVAQAIASPPRAAAAPADARNESSIRRPTVTEPRLAAAPARSSAPVGDPTHLVQLGSFSSEAGARRAWGIYQSRYPELADRELVITQAVVNGRNYWRVSAGGYDSASARSMCGRVAASNGDGCISWAANSPLPGALDTGVRLARR